MLLEHKSTPQQLSQCRDVRMAQYQSDSTHPVGRLLTESISGETSDRNRFRSGGSLDLPGSLVIMYIQPPRIVIVSKVHGDKACRFALSLEIWVNGVLRLGYRQQIRLFSWYCRSTPRVDRTHSRMLWAPGAPGLSTSLLDVGVGLVATARTCPLSSSCPYSRGGPSGVRTKKEVIPRVCFL